MYQVLLIFMLVCLGQWSSAQQNHYFNDNARWVYQTEESYEPGQIFMYSGLEENTILGDTILDGTLHKKLYKRFIHYNSTKPPFPHLGTNTTSYEKRGPTFIRYDSSANKVYYREHADSLETLIYNFNLAIGDTINLRSEYFIGNNVKRIDTIPLFEGFHKLFILDTFDYPYRNGIISGVGGLNGLTYNQPAFGALGGGILMTDLVCFEFNDSTYLSPWATHMQIPCPSRSDFLSSATDIKKDGLVVFPNPNTGSFTLKIPEELVGSSYFIYNKTGAVMYSSEITQSPFNVEIPTAGLYFWRIITKAGGSHTGKILVNRF
ncbi:MAG: T9SS type A sorting domain-containing protein [Saprospiraceae bacterium]|nr:T9SS type A sorting domain-containing protein [Saprospiraceae bacterium]